MALSRMLLIYFEYTTLYIVRAKEFELSSLYKDEGV